MSIVKTGPKPKNPYPALVRRVLRRVLPASIYRRHIGRHEDESLKWWTRFAREVPPGYAVLDIGAFDGEYAIAARRANPAVPIFAFEPNPLTLPRLRRRVARLGISVVEAAVADKDGEASFVCRDAQSQLTSVPASSTSEDQVEVLTVQLDAWSRRNAVKPALIKIDVECAEPRVLRGARKILATIEPIILCEVLSDAAGEQVQAMLPAHYCLLEIDENRGIRERHRVRRRRWRDKNWLFVPPGKLPDDIGVREVDTDLHEGGRGDDE